MPYKKFDYGCFTKNLIVLRCSCLCRNAIEFSKILKLKNEKRLSEVEKGRLHPNKEEIAALEKSFRYSFSQLCGMELTLKTEFKNYINHTIESCDNKVDNYNEVFDIEEE